MAIHWRDRRVMDLLGIDVPILQAPMAGFAFAEMVAAVAEAGGLGSLGCAVLSPEQMRAEVASVRLRTARPINLNFFCHQPPVFDEAVDLRWRSRLAGYFEELGLDWRVPPKAASRTVFDAAMCDLVAELNPGVVSFHFGLPEDGLVRRLQSAGLRVLSSATTVAEARWLEDRGCDAIIAQGVEAGGHRGIFLTDDLHGQVGTMALVPQIVDAVRVPVIAAGGIGDGRGMAAALLLGASAVQMGTAFLFCPEARVNALHRAALRGAGETAVTNVFTGRPARGFANRIVREVGPISEFAPPFPLASGTVAVLRGAAEAAGSSDFTPMWAGQGVGLGREGTAGELIERVAEAAGEVLGFGRRIPAGPASGSA